MSIFNNNRKTIIQIIYISVFVVIIGQLTYLQLFSSKYRLDAERNAMFRRVIYPDRGIIFDRKRHSMLENTIMYDLVVIPSEAKGIDTVALCNLLEIDTIEYRRRIRDISYKNTSVRPSVFEPILSPEMYARLSENIYKFPGFTLNERSVRSYPFNTAANVMGYIAEADTSFLRRHREEGYEMGDYAGMTGLERTYEKVLMGRRGVKRFLRDNHSRIQGAYENGMFDTSAVAGKNLYSSIDVELQQLGEKLMNNKVGSIVAIDPRTGGILCMISAPTYNPNYLTGGKRRKHFAELYQDPRLPLLNRSLATYYSPGSTFKTFVGIVGMSEGAINDRFTVGCGGAYYGCGRKMGCHAKGTFNLKGAISESCNSYFATVYRRILDQGKYPSIDSSLSNINRYAYSFGLGRKLGVDLPSEKKGNIPTAKYYQKIFGRNWHSCNIVSNSIGQGEVLTTLTQLSNMMAIIANKGWYYTPHLIDSIEGGDEFHLLDSFKNKHYTVDVPDSVFEDVHSGMQGTMEFGTGAAAKVPGVVVCGKTGTVENYYHGEKQQDHAFFGAFAPRDNPRIAIAVMCENAGFGATSAAPIASLMIEKYLKDSIVEEDRKKLVEEMSSRNLIPKRMKIEMARQDSVRKAKINEALLLRIQQQQDAEDSAASSEDDSAIAQNAIPQQNDAPGKDGQKPRNDSNAVITIDEKKNINKKRHQ